MSLVMYDSVDPGQIPADAQFLAGYIDGAYANSAELADRFPRARLLTIAVFAQHDAECLDIETGDATPGQAPGWYARQRARGITRPCLYASASVMGAAVIPAISAAGIRRGTVRLWSAHYTGTPHICGPSSCGLTSIEMDGTQWTSRALGRTLDQSLLADGFFSTLPATGWTAAMIADLPTLRQGDTGNDVRTIQALCAARGHATAVDGAFGAATATSVRAVQTSYGIGVDGIAGQDTWTVLVTAAKP